MKILIWLPWILAICVCLAEARYKLRRPLGPMPPQPPQMYKKSWPIGHRMSGGNTIHINSHSNFPPKRVPVFQKPNNFRRPPPARPVFNAPPVWKNQIPILSAIPNPAVLPQRQPAKEFQVMSKVPEYSPEYRPEPMALPPTHRGGIDDDKGPIHTIPAPNLSPADKPYDHNEPNEQDEDQRQFVADAPYNPNGQAQNPNYNYHNLPTSQHTPSRPLTTPPPTQNIYEVTETNEVPLNHFETSSPNYYPPDFDPSRIQQSPNELPSNDLFLSHPPISRSGVIGNTIQFPQQSLPMQTNLHSSLHVGFPGSGQEQQQQHQQAEIQPDLHVGHPAPAGPPLSATQLYDLLNSFPQQGDDGHFPSQVPPQIIQQQLGQMFQGNPQFSQPQMHSFNYDEQANKRQQQILVNQNYASGRVTAGYNLHPDQSIDVRSNGQQELAEPSGQAENNIEFDAAQAGTSHQPVQNQFFSSSGSDAGLPTAFYTTLPNREAAEKLAALAAAGNVNSQLIGQLKKQQKEETQGDEPLPNNHRVEYQVNEEIDDVPFEEERVRYRFAGQKEFSRQRIRQQQIKQEQEKADKHYEQQQRLQEQRDQEQEQQEQRILEQRKKPEEKKDKQKPLRIMVPEVQEKSSQETYAERSGEDYDYENAEPENQKGSSNEEKYENAEFGSRLGGKSGK